MLSKNQVKDIQSLHQKKQRDQRKLFIVEGIKTVNELIRQKPDLVSAIYATRVFIENNQVLARSGAKYTEVTEDDLVRISLQSNPNGVLALCRYFDETTDGPDLETGFSFYLDDIRDPGNFGTIVRLASWFGVSTLYCSPGSCDVYNPKVIQSTMGAFLRVRVVYIGLKELLEKEKIHRVYGAVLNGKNIYTEALESGLVVIGNEAKGIGTENLKHINRPVTIPAAKGNASESLNAAMAASIIASEFFRRTQN